MGEPLPGGVTPPATVGRVNPPPAPAVASPATEDEPTDEDSETASAPAAPPRALPPGSKPYNIQIEAVMDKSGTDEMVSRLKDLGYNEEEVKTVVNGPIWYRVRVGPDAGADKATPRHNELRRNAKQDTTAP